MEIGLNIRELTMESLLLRCLLAIVLSGIIGLERGLKNRAAGFRTYMLVCLGASIVMTTNQYVCQIMGTGDPVRMGAQVVSGIGFLGAGTIIVTSRSQIKGLTTAAGLWASACMGLAIGIGFYEIAVIGSVCIFLVMTIFHSWESWMRRNSKMVTVYIELSTGSRLIDFLNGARAMECGFGGFQVQCVEQEESNAAAFLVGIRRPRSMKKCDMLKALREMHCVGYLEEL